ncbi:hypothetical protein H2199_005018 [Coniosporium tulheliwenetii]|uniref:Uncharacterized protein n=1 Tax=Coniosporium tulheliwenetii TaxID=3383036 RepID=A0ACC2Z3N4_9PEZI|nr:hypothetical protein H2199_005018 [Cladosporium sp. JES 115]
MAPSAKRKHPTEAEKRDPTGTEADGASRPTKAPRLSQSQHLNKQLPSPRTSPAHNGTSSQRSIVIADDEDEDESEGAGQAIGLSQSYDESTLARYMLYGTLNTKIILQRLRNCGEMVILNREPNNPYDSNAIQVQNVRREQIGHIPRQVAAKLAKYMDSRDLAVEGFIAGKKEYYDCPISLKLYGTSEPVGRMELVNKMKSDKLPLEELKAREKAEKARIKEAALAAKKAKKGAPGIGNGQIPEAGNGQWAAGLSQGDGMGPNMEELIAGSERFNPRNVEQMVEQFGTKEEDLANMPMAEQPEALAAKLLPFQRQGLKWMLDQESPQLPPAGSKEAVQLWTRSAKEANAFTNLATSFTQRSEPELASGGILADDMGLGKTVQVISLIMADRALKKARSPSVCGATLILAPLSVMSNWSSQIKRHI